MKALQDEMGPLKLWLFVSLLFHLIAATYSVGFHHYDEHFQILEWVSYKMGNTPASDLAWEFEAQIRPWLLPAFFYVIAVVWKAIGVVNPFVWTLSYQLMSAVLGWVTLVLMIYSGLRWLSPSRLSRWFAMASALLWFFPFLHARTSSENWGGTIFFLGLAILTIALPATRDLTKRAIPAQKALFVGACCGLSFYFRFQMGVCVFFLGMWCLFIARLTPKTLSYLALGLVATLALGACVDRWGYGSWVVSPWHYFEVNLLQDRASQFGVHPWYEYLKKILYVGGPPLSLAFLIFPILAWLFRPTHFLTWVTLPFFLIHCWIGHKELRFLFPIALALPGLVFLGIETLRDWKAFPFNGEKLDRPWVARALLIFNVVLLIPSAISPARVEVPFFEYIYKNEIKEVFSTVEQPYNMAGLQIFYYRPKGIQLHRYAEAPTLQKKLSDNEPFWLLDPMPALSGPFAPLANQCQIKKRSVPDMALETETGRKIIRFSRALVWSLYYCSG